MRRPRQLVQMLLLFSLACMAAEVNAHAALHRKLSTRRIAHAARRTPGGALRSHHGAAGYRSKPSARSAILISHRSHRLRTSSRSVRALIPPVQRVRFVPAMKGSRESLVRQNVIADAEGLDRIEDDSELARLVDSANLVALPASSGLHINDAMPMNRRYCRPRTAKFLNDLARVHSQRFGSPLVVTSAVRTAEYQRHLLLINGNAAPAEGALASPHLTGAAIDIAKKGMSMSEIGWLRAYLLPLQSTGKIDVEEEFRQACFHITVYASYQPPATAPAVPSAPSRRHGTRSVMLAARLR